MQILRHLELVFPHNTINSSILLLVLLLDLAILMLLLIDFLYLFPHSIVVERLHIALRRMLNFILYFLYFILQAVDLLVKYGRVESVEI